MQAEDKVYIAGHRGMVGSAIVRKLRAMGYERLVYRSSEELDLRSQSAVTDFFATERPDYVFLAAARVGGILANDTYKATFLYDNLMIESNIIHAAHLYGVKKLLFLGSSCIYPRLAPQPLREEYLLTGALEPTNEPYAIAKIAGIKLCEAYRHQYGSNFISVMPTNLYGPGDNYDLAGSHVLPALIRKFHEAAKQGLPEVVIWGTGSPRREFLHVDDLAEACYFLMQTYNQAGFLNIGTGEDLSILELAHLIRSVVGYEGRIVHDLEKPDGTPRKLLDVSRLKALGWEAGISLEAGIRSVYEGLKGEAWY
ncbi:MAG: GDP-L-fucose synthase [Saprospiraceae bacterium]|nr:GDP-L-fucose synthase [Saprospiraceae bacterium]MDP4997602.1 GDP-L-fucose synthase [Saprospiraceae bacterium]